MVARSDGLRSTVSDIEGGCYANLLKDIPFSTPIITGATVAELVRIVDGTYSDKDGTRPNRPCADII